VPIGCVSWTVGGVEAEAADALHTGAERRDVGAGQRGAGGQAAEAFGLAGAVAAQVVAVAGDGAQRVGLQRLAVHRVVGEQRRGDEGARGLGSVVARAAGGNKVLAGGDRGLVAEAVVAEADAEAFGVGGDDRAVERVEACRADAAVGVGLRDQVAAGVVAVGGGDLQARRGRVDDLGQQAARSVVAELGAAGCRAAGAGSLEAQVAEAIVLARDDVALAVALRDDEVAAVVLEAHGFGALDFHATGAARLAEDACQHAVAEGVVVVHRNDAVAVGAGDQAVEVVEDVLRQSRVGGAVCDSLAGAVAEGVVGETGDQRFGRAGAERAREHAVGAVVGGGAAALGRASCCIDRGGDVAQRVVLGAAQAAVGQGFGGAAVGVVVAVDERALLGGAGGAHFGRQAVGVVVAEGGDGAQRIGARGQAVGGVEGEAGAARIGAAEGVDLLGAVAACVVAHAGLHPYRAGLGREAVQRVVGPGGARLQRGGREVVGRCEADLLGAVADGVVSEARRVALGVNALGLAVERVVAELRDAVLGIRHRRGAQ
jgi:hypothetical protein